MSTILAALIQGVFLGLVALLIYYGRIWGRDWPISIWLRSRRGHWIVSACVILLVGIIVYVMNQVYYFDGEWRWK